MEIHQNCKFTTDQRRTREGSAGLDDVKAFLEFRAIVRLALVVGISCCCPSSITSPPAFISASSRRNHLLFLRRSARNLSHTTGCFQLMHWYFLPPLKRLSRRAFVWKQSDYYEKLRGVMGINYPSRGNRWTSPVFLIYLCSILHLLSHRLQRGYQFNNSCWPAQTRAGLKPAALFDDQNNWYQPGARLHGNDYTGLTMHKYNLQLQIPADLASSSSQLLPGLHWNSTLVVDRFRALLDQVWEEQFLIASLNR